MVSPIHVLDAALCGVFVQRRVAAASARMQRLKPWTQSFIINH